VKPQQRLRKVAIALFMELLAEFLPLSILAAVAFVHQKPFPFEEVVSSCVVLSVAFGFLLMTCAEFWIDGHEWDHVSVCVVIYGFLICALMGLGLHLHFIGLPHQADFVRRWFWYQLIAAMLALFFAALARSARES
jgi:hypothetical protein